MSSKAQEKFGTILVFIATAFLVIGAFMANDYVDRVVAGITTGANPNLWKEIACMIIGSITGGIGIFLLHKSKKSLQCPCFRNGARR